MRSGARPSGAFTGKRVVLIGEGFDERAALGQQVNAFASGATQFGRLSAIGTQFGPTTAELARSLLCGRDALLASSLGGSTDAGTGVVGMNFLSTAS